MRLLILAACAVACVAQAQPGPLSPEELYRRLAPSVWVVRTYDADGIAARTGSAVVIGPETLLTNCHVLEKAKRFVVRNDNVQHDAKLQYIDVQRDLCQITERGPEGFCSGQSARPGTQPQRRAGIGAAAR